MAKKIDKFKSSHGSLMLILAIAANLAIQLIAGFIVAGASIAGKKDISTSAYFNFILMLLIQVAFCGVYFLILRSKKIIQSPVNIKNKLTWWAVPVAAVIGVLAIPAFYPLTLWFMLALEKLGFVESGMVEMKTAGEYILGILVIVVAAPIGEELIFRSGLLPSLKLRYGTKLAVIFSALAFMLMHMNPSQTAYQFMLGIVLAIAALATKSVIIPVVIHAASNLIAILLDLTALGTFANNIIGYFYNNILLGVIVSIIVTAIFSFAIFALLKFLHYAHKGKSLIMHGSVFNENSFGTANNVDSRIHPVYADLKNNAVNTDSNKKIHFVQTKVTEEQAEINPFNDYTAETQNEDTAKKQTQTENTEKKQSDFICQTLYIATVSVCALVWILMFFVSKLSL